MLDADSIALTLKAQGRVLPDLPRDAPTRLATFLAILEKWNRTYNLTAIREPERMLTHHILDSLAVAPYLGADTLADVGSGAGLPGIPLAISRPDLQVFLIEPNSKKATFLRMAAKELSTENVTVLQSRVEDVKDAYENVVSRAMAAPTKLLQSAGRLVAPCGRLIAMCGRHLESEWRSISLPNTALRNVTVEIPAMNGEVRQLLIWERRAA